MKTLPKAAWLRYIDIEEKYDRFSLLGMQDALTDPRWSVPRSLDVERNVNGSLNVDESCSDAEPEHDND